MFDRNPIDNVMFDRVCVVVVQIVPIPEQTRTDISRNAKKSRCKFCTRIQTLIDPNAGHSHAKPNR